MELFFAGIINFIKYKQGWNKLTHREAVRVLGSSLEALLAYVSLSEHQHTPSKPLEFCGEASRTGHGSKPPLNHIYPSPTPCSRGMKSVIQACSALIGKATRAGRAFQGHIKVLRGRGMAGSGWTPSCHPVQTQPHLSYAPGHCTVLTKHIQAHQSQSARNHTAAEPRACVSPP